MSARPGPGRGSRATAIPTPISNSVADLKPNREVALAKARKFKIENGVRDRIA